jgi:hypothetical protein
LQHLANDVDAVREQDAIVLVDAAAEQVLHGQLGMVWNQALYDLECNFKAGALALSKTLFFGLAVSLINRSECKERWPQYQFPPTSQCIFLSINFFSSCIN